MILLRLILGAVLGALAGWLITEPWTDSFSYWRDYAILAGVSLGIIYGLIAEKYIFFRKWNYLLRPIKHWAFFVIPLMGIGLVKLVFNQAGEQKHAGAVDIAFLIDTSGSMQNELDGIKSACVSFAQNIESSGIDCRLGLIDFDYDGRGRDHSFELFPLEEDPLGFRQSIEELRIARLGGQGCYIASKSTLVVFEAIPSLFQDPSRKKNLIIVSDELGGDEALDNIISIMKRHDITVHVVGVEGRRKTSAHEQIAKALNGKFWRIKDSRSSSYNFSDLLLGQITVAIKAQGISEVSNSTNKTKLSFGNRLGGWALFGLLIGLTVGLIEKNRDKFIIGILGGTLGGAISALIFLFLDQLSLPSSSSRMVSFAILGIIIALALWIVQTIYYRFVSKDLDIPGFSK